MKTYKNLYKKLYSEQNLLLAFKKARIGKSKKDYVISFQSNLNEELKRLQEELKFKTYIPKKLKKFVIRDPKTRTIHASVFRDRVVHHAVINLLEPIFDKRFIYDSFASRDGKGTHKAVLRFKSFLKKVSSNGRLIKKPFNNNSIRGFILKADIKHYFDSMDHEVLIRIIRKRIKDEDLIWLIRSILENFDGETKWKGLPLGNYTSQFFANIYLNELDYFIKHNLKAKYYIRYVDDFVILHRNKKRLEYFMKEIKKHLNSLRLELHPEKSKIFPLRNGVKFLGYRIFYNYSLLRKRNLRHFIKKFENNLYLCKEGILTLDQLENKLNGWFGYSCWANTYNLRKGILSELEKINHNKMTNTKPKDI